MERGGKHQKSEETNIQSLTIKGTNPIFFFWIIAAINKPAGDFLLHDSSCVVAWLVATMW